MPVCVTFMCSSGWNDDSSNRFFVLPSCGCKQGLIKTGRVASDSDLYTLLATNALHPTDLALVFFCSVQCSCIVYVNNLDIDYLCSVWLNTSPAAPASPAPLSTSPASDVCKCHIGPSVAWLSVLSSVRPPPTLLLSGMLIGGGGYMTAPSPLVPGRSPVTSFC